MKDKRFELVKEILRLRLLLLQADWMGMMIYVPRMRYNIDQMESEIRSLKALIEECKAREEIKHKWKKLKPSLK